MLSFLVALSSLQICSRFFVEMKALTRLNKSSVLRFDSNRRKDDVDKKRSIYINNDSRYVREYIIQIKLFPQSIFTRMTRQQNSTIAKNLGMYEFCIIWEIWIFSFRFFWAMSFWWFSQTPSSAGPNFYFLIFSFS